MEVKDGKLTVKGEIDAYIIVKKLKKICHIEIISVGPEKKPDEKKPDEKKPDDKKLPDVIYVPPCPPYYNHFNGYYNEDPNACVIS